MTSRPSPDPMSRIDIFWWAFGIRGGFAILFSGILAFSGNLLGSLFFDPIMLVMMSVLLGFYVLANALLLGVAAGFALQHRLRLGWLLAAESCFALLLGAYIGFSLLITSQSIALLAGLHAVGAGCFQVILALRLHRNKQFTVLLSVSGIIAVIVGSAFLMHQAELPRLVSLWLSGFELMYGLVVVAFARALHRVADQQNKEDSVIAQSRLPIGD